MENGLRGKIEKSMKSRVLMKTLGSIDIIDFEALKCDFR